MLRKRLHHYFYLLTFIFSLLLSGGFTAQAQHNHPFVEQWIDEALFPRVIYGYDNRVEAREFPHPTFRRLSESVAGMVSAFKLFANNEGDYIYPQITLSDEMLLCEDEAFSDQLLLPHCTGFLIAPDLILTAGHCVPNRHSCISNVWVFGLHHGDNYPVPAKNKYRCVELLDTQFVDEPGRYFDYSIVRLDRKVEQREPLQLQTQKRVRRGTPLIVISHPSALPLKTSDGGEVLSLKRRTGESRQPLALLNKRRYAFGANLDTFAGSSGAPIFNQNNAHVVGILSKGEQDYYFDEDSLCHRPVELEKKPKVKQEVAFRVNRIPNLRELIKESYQRHR